MKYRKLLIFIFLAIVLTIKINTCVSYAATPLLAEITGKPVFVGPKSNSSISSNSSDSGGSSSSDSDNSASLINGLLSGLDNLPEKFVNFILTPVKEYYVSKITDSYNKLDMALKGFQSLLANDDSGSGFYIFARTLWSLLLPFGYSLVALFFVIGFCKKTTYFETMNNLEIIKLMLKLILGKTFLDKSIDILSVIMGLNRDIVRIVLNSTSSINSSLLNAAKNETINGSNVIDKLQSMVLYLISNEIITTVMLLLIIICYVVINLRNIELAVLIATAPLFFSTMVSDVTNDVFKAYMKNFISVVLQTLWISVSVAFLTNSYMSGVTGASDFSVFNFLISILTLAIFAVKAPSSVRNAIGGSGGNGMNIASLAMLLK